MMNKNISSARLGEWLIVAMSGPFAYLAGRQSWTTILAVSAICLLALWAVLARPTSKLLALPFLCLLEYGFLTAVCFATSSWSSDIWPTGQGYPVVPLTLLGLSIASAWFGANRASKGIGVLFWMIAILYSILLSLGLRNVEPRYLMPKWETPAPTIWFAFLLPCAAQFLPRENDKRSNRYIAALAGLALLFALWTEGNLSLDAAQQVSWPFYEAGESVHLFGIANRLESLISMAVTIGFYGLYSLLLSGTFHLAEGIRSGWGKYGVLTAGILSGAGVLRKVTIPGFVLVAGAFVLWIALPVFGSLFSEKKRKKTENNA